MLAEAVKAKYHNKLGEALILITKLAEALFEIEEKWADYLYADMLHQRGVILQMDKNWAGAYEELLDAARMRKRIGDYVGLAYSMFQIAMLKMEQTGNETEATPSFMKARPYIEFAIRVAEERRDIKTLGDLKHNIAFIDQVCKAYENAIIEYQEALAFRIKAKDKRGEALTKARLAECYFALDDIENSVDLANDALRYFIETDDKKRIEQVRKAKEMIPVIAAKKIEQKIKELNELYSKATTEEQYKECVKIAGEINELTPRCPSLDTEELMLKALNSWWAYYYYLLKFDQSQDTREQFIEQLGSWYRDINNVELKIKFGYLYATALSNLTGETEEAEKINQEIKVLAEKTNNMSLLLQVINSRGLKEMAAKDWHAAIAIFSEIDVLHAETVTKQENLQYAANIVNNRGASKNRGKIAPIGGAIDLMLAAILYSQQEMPPAKHFKGLPDRLQESIDNLNSVQETIPNKEEIIYLIKEARALLSPVSDQIQKKQPPWEYFETLRSKIEEIREKLMELNK